jgi:cysteine desulfurase
MAHEKGILFHTDAVQAVGKVAIDLKSTKIDMLSLSGHKLHAPKGIGVLYLRRNTASARCCAAVTRSAVAAPAPRTRPRSSASASPANWRSSTWPPRTPRSSACATAGSAASSPGRQCLRQPATLYRLPNTSSIAFEYVEGEGILLLLNKQGIAASSGSACTSGSLEPSHVMRAMGIPYTAAHGTIRFSLSRYNTEEEVDRVIATVPPIIAQLRKLSPVLERRADFFARWRIRSRPVRSRNTPARSRARASPPGRCRAARRRSRRKRRAAGATGRRARRAIG